MSCDDIVRGVEGGNKIPWKVAKRAEANSIKLKMLAWSSLAVQKLPHLLYQKPPMLEAGGQLQTSHTADESSSSTSRSDLFDRSPSHTATDDTGPSSISSFDIPEALPLASAIIETPTGYASVKKGGQARKRVALSNSGPTIPKFGQRSYHAATRVEQPENAPETFESSVTVITPGQVSPERPDIVSSAWPTHWRASSSIPESLSWEEYGRQCVLAANASRLNPYALSSLEYRLLQDKLPQSQATAYLNIRNGILRLWTRNPMVCVTQEEAAGCAKHSRHFTMASIAYKWLVRNGYINFGCVEPLRAFPVPSRGRRSSRQTTIAIVGAGMSGLGCARQLENLIAQLQDSWTSRGEQLPHVIVLEGRKRIGGRVYSHPLRSQVQDSLPKGLRNTAEMGAQIITGFQQGNPMDIIVRGQLGLHYHLMWDEITMHDSDGRPVNHERDMLVNKVHNDILERTSDFRLKPTIFETLEGNPDLIDICQESVAVETGRSEGQDANGAESIFAAQQDRTQVVPPGFAKLQGRTQVVAGNSSSRTAAQAARSAGWELRPGISKNHTLNLQSSANGARKPNLGTTMDEAVRQYQQLVQLTPQDMRLLNWHYADLEYANAAMVHQLSLSGHDQDSGNEFEGRHSEVVGGYIQVPRGLMMLPHQLDVQFGATAKHIAYSKNGNGPARIECTNGEVIEADRVVLSTPLGVLKAGSITFQPPLPSWKQGAIERLGFGLLNKLVLVFEKPFWDQKYDMFGLLNDAERRESLDPGSYAQGRGKFYLVWNCISNSGRPMLIALMSGNAAHAAEVTPTEVLVKDVLARLSRTFAPKPVPAPVEVIVTRWKKDPFTRGTYSFVAPGTQPGDYDVMAAPVGNLHFAGEATCGTHPATVHGAYLSGLRAAAEVVESLIGPIAVPETLVSEGGSGNDVSEPLPPIYRPPAPLLNKVRVGRPPKSQVRIKQEPRADAVPALSTTPAVNPYRMTANSRVTQDEVTEDIIRAAIVNEIGERPLRPIRTGVNPFLLYTAEKWRECKAELSARKQATTGRLDVQATRNEVRVAIGVNWRNLSEEAKKPYVERGAEAQRLADDQRRAFDQGLVEWEKNAARIRKEVIDGKHETLPGMSAPDSAAASAVNAGAEQPGEQRQESSVSGGAAI